MLLRRWPNTVEKNRPPLDKGGLQGGLVWGWVQGGAFNPSLLREIF
jgi:hypothetical protein